MARPHRVYNTPLTAKLGVGEDNRSLVVGPAPDAVMEQLPEVHRRAGNAAYDVVVAFCPDQRALTARLASLSGRITTSGSLWLCWPKRSSGMTTDLGEAKVRTAGLDSGLVDVKVAAVDPVWSALKFVLRRADR
jgi:hypothetical protein